MSLSKILCRYLAPLVAVFLLQSCSVLPKLEESESVAVNKQPPVELQQVPYIAQDDNLCGPAVLAMLSAGAGKSVSMQQYAPLVYVPGREGSLQIEMLAAPRQFGLMAIRVQPKLESIFSALNAGYAVGVLLNMSLPIAPQWHYAVVMGFDPQDQQIILRSGPYERQLIPIETFMALWNRSAKWGFILHKPENTAPHFITPQDFITAAVGLNQVNRKLSESALLQAADYWKDDAYVQFVAGNVYAARAEWSKAQTAYALSVQTKADFADAWNNLAEAQYRLKRKAQARESIEKAIALGGPNLKTYQQTADMIYGKRRP